MFIALIDVGHVHCSYRVPTVPIIFPLKVLSQLEGRPQLYTIIYIQGSEERMTKIKYSFRKNARVKIEVLILLPTFFGVIFAQ